MKDYHEVWSKIVHGGDREGLTHSARAARSPPVVFGVSDSGT
ncbi:hypothetical protein BH20ACT13_BH20ACT13_20270 [soil metagenome]